MASFTEDEINQHELDWQVLLNGGISLYLDSDLLAADLGWLRSRGYEIKNMDAGSWESQESMHDAFSSTLSFPSYYGRNLDAFTDCISEDLVVPSSGGIALCLNHFDRFEGASRIGHVVLDILARASRHHMLRGRRFLVLVQSDDPRITFTGLGGVNAEWNTREWLLKHRGL